MARVNHRLPILSITYLHRLDFVYIAMEVKGLLCVRCCVALLYLQRNGVRYVKSFSLWFGLVEVVDEA
jgi:hypothetical protein